MIKKVIVTFDYDAEANTVSNVLCSVDGVEKKKRTTKKKSDVEEELASVPLLKLEPNKLIFNNRCIADMEIEYEDKIIIRWEKQGKTLFPIIGKDIAFDEEGSGNKVTKSNSIGYKGKQNAVLAEFGSEFTIEPYKEGLWKLVSTTSPNTSKTLEETIRTVERVEPMLLTEKDEDTQIDELTFKL